MQRKIGLAAEYHIHDQKMRPNSIIGFWNRKAKVMPLPPGTLEVGKLYPDHDQKEFPRMMGGKIIVEVAFDSKQTTPEALVTHFNEQVLPKLRPLVDRQARRGRYTLGEFSVLFNESAPLGQWAEKTNEHLRQQETSEVLADPNALKMLKQGEEDIQAGRVYDHEDVKTMLIKEHEMPEELQAKMQVFQECLYTGPLTTAEYEILYGVKPIPQSRTTEALHQYGDPVAVPNEPTNIEEGGHLPPDKDFDELADMDKLPPSTKPLAVVPIWTDETKVSLLVGAQDLEDDDRYGTFAGALAGDTMTLGDIAILTEHSLPEITKAAAILYNEGYLEIV